MWRLEGVFEVKTDVTDMYFSQKSWTIPKNQSVKALVSESLETWNNKIYPVLDQTFLL